MHRWGNKKDAAGDDPPYLSVGTEVSAKYKGAFCEAKIRKVVKTVKCKVQYKNEQGIVFVNDDQIKGLLMHGACVEVRLADKKEPIEGTIVKIQDLSQYTVVFDDGDIATLRRTALCLKSGRHFADGETLDQLPLTHPEHFSTPVVSGSRGSRRRDDMDDNSDDEDKQHKIEREEDMGRVVCVEVGDKKKSKDNWFPGLVVAPTAQDSVKIDVEDEYLVRSFKDGRYYTVPKDEALEFSRDMATKIENATLKQAVDKAILFLDKSDLPTHWDRDQLFGTQDFPSDIDASDTDSLDDEPREEKDHFVAQLYKFMDDRGTPINKGPMISSKDVDLYKLFKIVFKFGGYNRVTNRNQWKIVAMKLGYDVNHTNNVKSSYKKFLHSFEDFYRKLGCTLLTTNRDNKLRSRSSRPLIRDRDKNIPERNVIKEETSCSSSEDLASNCRQTNAAKLMKEEKVVTKNTCDWKTEQGEKRQRSVEPIIDNVKEQLSDVITKDACAVQLIKLKEIKEKIHPEKRIERKSAKIFSKLEDEVDRKSSKGPLKKVKPIEKRIKKTETMVSKVKEKRSIKDKVKVMVKKFKFKSSVPPVDQDKIRKPKNTEEVNKVVSQGAKIKVKDELGGTSIKARKLSVGSTDSKSSCSSQYTEKKFGGLCSASSSNYTTETSMPTNKPRRNDEDGIESSKKKTYKKKKDGAKESLINQVIEFVPHYKTIVIGDKLKVYYEPTHESKVTYEAKVTNKRYGRVTEYLVHYTGWNTRYDEWIRRSRIADNLSWTPSRTKRRVNQPESPIMLSNTIAPQPEVSGPSSQTNGKFERGTRSSTSPIGKNGNKFLKSGIKQIRSLKNRMESKTKPIDAIKDSDSDSESDEDESSNEKGEIQNTRSRSERGGKQSKSKTIFSKNTADNKSKIIPSKRTRSGLGSIKQENDENPEKKAKLSTPLSDVKLSTKATMIRDSIMKSLIPKKRVGRPSKKDYEEYSRLTAAALDAANKRINDELHCGGEISNDLTEESIGGNVEESGSANENVVQIQAAVTSDKMVKSEGDFMEKSVENVKKPKKDSTDDETLVRPQIVTESYLSENSAADSKPKIINTKHVKKEPAADEKLVTPIKNICRSPSEKLQHLSKVIEMKEKTIFTSRSPSEKKPEKTPEKEGKRMAAALSSYLNMDKIDSIKKFATPEKIIDKLSSDSSSKRENDIYEFSEEPEPLNIDDKAIILHRRSTPRIFEETTTFKKAIKSCSPDPPPLVLKNVEPPELQDSLSIEKEMKKKESKSPEKDVCIKPPGISESKLEEAMDLVSEKGLSLNIEKVSHKAEYLSEKPNVSLSDDVAHGISCDKLVGLVKGLENCDAEANLGKENDKSVGEQESSRDPVINKISTDEKTEVISSGYFNIHISPKVIEGAPTLSNDESDSQKSQEANEEPRTVVPEKKEETTISKESTLENAEDSSLLCEETIPKSPTDTREYFDTVLDEYSCSTRVDRCKQFLKTHQIRKKDNTQCSSQFEMSGLTSPEDASCSPDASPSKIDRFSTTNFSIEKSCDSNKDSSENDTSSDTSEKPAKMKKYTYSKKNTAEYDGYLKKKDSEKNENMVRKKHKNSSATNEIDKEEDITLTASPKNQASLSFSYERCKQSSIASILAEIPPHFDSNQRIEFLEQKMQQIRKKYNSHKQEVASIDRKRRKLRRKEREGRMMTRNEANALL